MVKLERSSCQNSSIIPYKIKTDSDGNIMPIHKFTILFTRMIYKAYCNKKKEGEKVQERQGPNEEILPKHSCPWRE